MVSTVSCPAHADAEPPTVKGLPILGTTWRAYDDVIGLLVESYHKYGTAFTIKRFGKKAVILAGLKANQFYAENETTLFHSGQVYRTMMKESGTDYLFNVMDGPAHKHLRKVTGPAFSRQLIADAIPAVVANVIRDARGWSVGGVFDALHMTKAIAARQAGLALLGYTVTDEEEQAVARFSGTFVGAGADIYPSFVVGHPGYRNAKAKFFAMMRRLIAAQRQRNENIGCPATFLRVLMQKNRHDGAPLTDDDVLACSSFPFVMNSVYTSRILSYLIYELLRNASALERVQAEVDAVVTQGDFSITSLQRMSILRSAVKEVLRLYPLIPGLPRHAKSDFVFEGYKVQQGQKVIFASSVTHFLPEFFPDPWQFDLDRFLPPRNEQRHQRVMVPFGMGQHACLGSNIAEIMILATMTGLLGAVGFELADPNYKARRVALPLPGPEGFKLRIKRRTAARTGGRTPQLLSTDVVLLEAGEALPENLQARLLGGIETRKLKPGETIFRAGDRPSAFYIIARGEVETVRRTVAGDERQLLDDNDSFGGEEMLTEVPRAVSARAGQAESVELLVLDGAVYREFVGSYDLTALEIAALVRKRAVARGLAAAMPMLSVKLIAEVAPDCETMTAAPAEIIISQGDEASKFYIVLDGHVEVWREWPTGEQEIIARLSTGEYFGEIGLLENRPRTATVRAGSDGAVLVVLGKESILGLMGKSKQSESAVARTVARRMAELAAASRGVRASGPA
jgi:cytochrome P450/CRP-like cAMP-binding protein